MKRILVYLSVFLFCFIHLKAEEKGLQCTQGFFWNGKECINPCSTNICQSVSHSTSSCIPISAREYSCECEKGFSWNGKNCTSALLGTICTGQTKCYDNNEDSVFFHGITVCPGRTKCFDNNKEIPCPTSHQDEFFGQDAQYAKKKKCKQQSFQIKTVSNQNVVIDKNTGLIWQQSIPKEKYKWEDAVYYCENLTYAGYSDWRLPTPQELLTIVNNSKSDPAIDTTYFPNTPSGNFWSSYTSVNGTNDAWYVYFDLGNVSDRSKTNNYYVRCVR